MSGVRVPDPPPTSLAALANSQRRVARAAAGFIAALLIACSAAAQTSLRKIPADAPRGRFTAGPLPSVFIDGKAMRLAPGARILSTDNLTVTPNFVPAGTLVRYQLNPQGQIRTVWILTPTEAAAK